MRLWKIQRRLNKLLPDIPYYDIYHITYFIFTVQVREVRRKKLNFAKFPYIGKMIKQGVHKKDTNKGNKIVDKNTIISC